MPKAHDNGDGSYPPGPSTRSSGRGEEQLTLEHISALTDVANAQIKKDAARKDTQIAKTTDETQRRKEKRKKKGCYPFPHSPSHSPSTDDESDTEDEATHDRRQSRQNDSDSDKPTKYTKKSKCTRLYERINVLELKRIEMQTERKGTETELRFLKDSISACIDASKFETNEPGKTQALILTAEQFQKLMARAKLEGDYARIPEYTTPMTIWAATGGAGIPDRPEWCGYCGPFEHISCCIWPHKAIYTSC